MRRGGLVHNLFVGFLVLLTGLAFVLTAVAGWTHQTALVSDRFVAVVEQRRHEPAGFRLTGDARR